MRRLLSTALLVLLFGLLWGFPGPAGALSLPSGKCIVDLGGYPTYRQALEEARRFLPYHRFTEVYSSRDGSYHVTLGLLGKDEINSFFSSNTEGPLFPRTVNCNDGSDLRERQFPEPEESAAPGSGGLPSFSEVIAFAGKNLITLVFTLGLLFLGGKVVGKLTVGVGFFKFLALLYLAAILYEPLRGAPMLYAGAFLAGILANHFDLDDLAYWFSGLSSRFGGGMVALYQARSENARLQEKIRQLEEELDRMREERNRHSGARGSSQQDRWREEAKSSRKSSAGSGEKASSGKSGSSQQQSSSAGAKGGEDSLTRSKRERYLRTLGLSPSGSYSDEQIKKAFRAMAKKHHPDAQGGDPATFMAVKEAYDWLMDHV